MTDLLRMCSESECERIMIDGKWIGKEHPNYQQEVDAAEHITYGYCPEHLNNNSLQRQLIEKRRMRVAHLI